ncbi:MAG: DUF3473 domain-containing protein [Planctomycetia bacterium]|nr:DUF3473 domain-containing protein [Planctomycetia bacterium]
MDIVNALSIDVEDYFQVSAFDRHIRRESWPEYESRVVANTHKLLRLLDKHGVAATFFVLGWVAERYPQLVRDLHASGHEIGSHSYWHRLIYELAPDEFRQDLVRSRDGLEQIIGERVTAYRAPSFSITKASQWALDILVEEGFTSDSSIYPVHHDRYGIPDARPDIHKIETPSGDLWEFPACVLRVAGMNVPVSGGGYFRLYPLALTIRALKAVNNRLRRPFVFYVHPWEIDPRQPRLRVGSRLARCRHYLNLASTERKLDGLLSMFTFGRMCDVMAAARQGITSSSLATAV